jgi:hypothetical protein
MTTARESRHPFFGYAGLGYHNFVEIDLCYFRTANVVQVLGDFSCAQHVRSWNPQVDVKVLVAIMFKNDLDLFGREKTLRDAGHETPETIGHD